MHDTETRSLRRAAIVLLLVSLVRFGFPLLSRDPVEVESDVMNELGPAARQATEEADRRKRPLAPNERVDPNRADEIALDRLPGIGPSAAAAVVAARDTGVVFRRPEDLLAVRGIGPASLERIVGQLDLGSPPNGRRPRVRSATAAVGSRIDVNRADAVTLQGLPGIGPAIAERIVASRRDGPFSSVDELQRVRGIGPSTVERLRAHATVGPRVR